MTAKLIVISAPSGAGKTTLCAKLLAEFPDRLVLSISSTTRTPRGNERDGKEYHFLTREEFEAKIQAGRFAEWALVHGNYYGTSRDVIERSLTEGKSVLLDIDVQGADSMKKAYDGIVHRIFVSPPDLKTLEHRLRARGTDSEQTIQKRLRNAEQEMARASQFDKVIINDDLMKAFAELESLVRAQIGL